MISYTPDQPSPVVADDYVAIQRLVHRYADAVVNRNAEQWGSCWADDASWSLGQGRSVVGKADIVDLWTKAMGMMAAVVQVVHNGDAFTVEGDQDRATGRWYISESLSRVTGEVGILLAHYDDAYVRTPAGWRFSDRMLQPHYSGPPDLSAAFLNTVDGLRERGVLDA